MYDYRQGTEPANLGFRRLSNFLILIKIIPDWLYESHFITGTLRKGGGSHVLHIKGRHFCEKTPSYYISIEPPWKRKQNFLLSYIVFFSRLEDIKQNVWSRDQLLCQKYFFSEKIGRFQSPINIHWQVVLKKSNTL